MKENKSHSGAQNWAQDVDRLTRKPATIIPQQQNGVGY